MSEWSETTLADVCEDISYGYTASASDDPDLPRFLRITDIVPEAVDWRTVPGCVITPKEEAKHTLRPGDIVVARTGATVGYAKRIRREIRAVPASYLVRFRPAETVDAAFIGHIVESAAYKEYVRTNAGGSAQPNANAKVLGSYRLRVPNLSTQRRISSILGSIDDLIENNRRRIEVLEEMAQAIYRQWFVHFRYPGHEDATFVDSPLGPIPEGWAPTTLGNCSTNYDRLRKPLSKMERSARPGPYPYYGAAKLIDWIDDWIFEGEYLLFAEDGSVQTPDGFPVLQLIDCEFWPNNHTHILQGEGVSTRFLYLASQFQPVGAFVTGAAQPKITQQNLNRIPVVRPGPTVLADFDRVVGPVLDEWRSIQRQRSSLMAMRDLLLPKLVTGEIDVSQIDLDVVFGAAS